MRNTKVVIWNSQSDSLLIYKGCGADSQRLDSRSGGSDGLRDRGLLESAIARARNKSLYEPDATIAEVGASLSYGLVKNHAFVDGNKRIGLAILIVCLKVNGYRLTCLPAEETQKIKQLAGSEITELEWTAWVAANSALSKLTSTPPEAR